MTYHTTNTKELNTVSTSAISSCITTSSLFNEYVRFISRGTRPKKTVESYLCNLRQFFCWLNYSGITEPTRDTIDDYIKWLSSPQHDAIIYDPVKGWAYRRKNGQRVKVTLTSTTICQYARCVSQFFRWTAINNYYPNIAEGFYLPKANNQQHRKSALTPEEVLTVEQSIQRTGTQKIEQSATATKDRQGSIQRATEQSLRAIAIYSLAVNAGLRTVEIARLRTRDIQVIGGTPFIFVHGKGHSEADTKKAIAQEVYQSIMDYLSVRTDCPKGESPLFITTGNRSKGKAIEARTIGCMLKQALKEAGFNGDSYTAHSLRHSTGTNLMTLTNNVYTVQQYLRHANPSTTETYLHDVGAQKEADTAEQLYALYHGIQKDNNETLSDIVSKLTPEQLEALVKVARNMTA